VGQDVPTNHVLEKVAKLLYLDRSTPSGKGDMQVIKHKLGNGEIQPAEIELVDKAFKKCDDDISDIVTAINEALE
jgi:hypothetical protein